MSAVTVFYGEDININPFMSSGALGTVLTGAGGAMSRGRVAETMFLEAEHGRVGRV